MCRATQMGSEEKLPLNNLSPRALHPRFADHVSTETRERLRMFESMLKKWNRSVNLISKGTLNHLWERHFEDSAQLLDCAPEAKRWLDVGSGGGFPGLVLVIMAAERGWEAEFTLIESSAKKCSFLRCVLFEIGLSADVLETRCENAEPQNADAVTARALAPLPKLLAMTTPHVSPHGVLIFPKGRKRQQEVVKARQMWTFDLQEKMSRTDADSAILLIKGAESAKTAT